MIETANKRVGIFQKTGVFLKSIAEAVLDDVIGVDPANAVRKLREEEKSGKILNPTGAKVGDAIVRVTDPMKVSDMH